MFEAGIDEPLIFRLFLRTAAYFDAYLKAYLSVDGEASRNIAEIVHNDATRFLNANLDILERRFKEFDIDDMKTEVKGRVFVPFGPAAGFDKNGDLLEPFSRVFGFLKPGTVVVPYREGNKAPRIDVDHVLENIDNAQGFPSEGLEYFLAKLILYRQNELPRGVRKPVYASICGIPPSPDKMNQAYKEMEILIANLLPYVDGFEWNPFSPNTASLQMLRTPEHFEATARFIHEMAGEDILKLVKMGPYRTEEERKESFRLAEAWMKGGGDGFTVVNTLKVPKNWPYGSAGRSGRDLTGYMIKAVTDLRREFPESVISATGGIFDPYLAYTLFRDDDKKVNMVEGYTPYTFYGLGLAKLLMYGVLLRMKRGGYQNMTELQRRVATSQTSSGRS
ncbi:MAG: hypothetical protein HYW26_01670 [Candidatus Aenigmarchaeota archaeon]|nr:hypothetical protein [Candidatus Aenigmarchaeota archaeon]